LIFHGHNVVSAVSESERKPPNAKSANAWRIVDTICGSVIESDVEDATANGGGRGGASKWEEGAWTIQFSALCPLVAAKVSAGFNCSTTSTRSRSEKDGDETDEEDVADILPRLFLILLPKNVLVFVLVLLLVVVVPTALCSNWPLECIIPSTPLAAMIVASVRLFARFETRKERKQRRRAWGGLFARASRYKAQK
jgi:hypothetical protein